MITAIIMASGFSRRMKMDKLTLEVDGAPIVERIILAIKKSKIDDIIITYRDDKVRLIAEKQGIKTVCNKDAYKGQSESIKIGINSSNASTIGFAFFVGDQPYLSTEVIDELIKVFYEDPSRIIIPLYKGKKGNPVIFPRTCRNKLLELKGDVGGKKVIEEMAGIIKHVNIDDDLSGIDIDTWEEYKYLDSTYVK